MRLMRAVLGVLVLSVLVVGLAVACGGDNDEESEEPVGVTSPKAAEPTAEEDGEDGENGGVIRTFEAGSASATVNIGGETLTYEGGQCDLGSDNEWLAVNIGEVGGDTYFGLVAGNNPGIEGARPAEGGGEFTEEDFLVTWVSEGTPGILGGGTLTVASDLASGDFEGSDLDGSEVTGSFACE
jgi:hypothetical protein